MEKHRPAKLTTLSVIFVVLTCSSAGGGLSLSVEKQTVPGLTADDVKGYRKMSRMNKRPIDMQEETKLLCGRPLWDPHDSPGLVYYINETAELGMPKFRLTKRFPVGSIIVKEKQETRTEDSVEIITAMKKIKAGKGEDTWDYKMYEVANWQEIDASKKVMRIGTKELTMRCIDCHKAYRETDYISSRGIRVLFGDDSR